jgi:hypothetical protein
MSHPVPDPAPDCPTCHYWEQRQARLAAEAPRPLVSRWPNGIDQRKALDILTAAFPNSYGAKR